MVVVARDRIRTQPKSWLELVTSTIWASPKQHAVEREIVFLSRALPSFGSKVACFDWVTNLVWIGRPSSAEPEAPFSGARNRNRKYGKGAKRKWSIISIALSTTKMNIRCYYNLCSWSRSWLAEMWAEMRAEKWTNTPPLCRSTLVRKTQREWNWIT